MEHRGRFYPMVGFITVVAKAKLQATAQQSPLEVVISRWGGPDTGVQSQKLTVDPTPIDFPLSGVDHERLVELIKAAAAKYDKIFEAGFDHPQAALDLEWALIDACTAEYLFLAKNLCNEKIQALNALW